MQKWHGYKNAKAIDEHIYVDTVPTYKFNILGQKINSSSQLRDMFPTLDISQQKKFIREVFGKYSTKIHKLLQRRLINQ